MNNRSRQSFSWGGLMKASGIIGVLFIIGMILYLTHIGDVLGIIAIAASVLIGIIYALLGIYGILKRLGLVD